MNEIFKLKRKAHYLINYLFYFIVFFAGFYIGKFLNGNFPDLKSLLAMFGVNL